MTVAYERRREEGGGEAEVTRLFGSEKLMDESNVAAPAHEYASKTYHNETVELGQETVVVLERSDDKRNGYSATGDQRRR